MCVTSLCELLSSVPHFNYRSNIIQSIVRYLDSKEEKIREKVSEHIIAVFNNDTTHGEATLEIVETLCNYINDRDYKVKSSVY